MNPQQNQDPYQNQPIQPDQAPSPQPIPPAQPIYPTPGTNQPAPEPPKKSRTKLMLVIAVLILLGGGAAAYFVTKNNNTKDIGGSASLNGSNTSSGFCIPIISTAPDQSSLATTYQRFASAVSNKNTNCVNSLATSYFLANAKQKFGSSDWMTYKFNGRASMADDFSQLPATLSQASFKQTDYTRSLVAGSSDQTKASGTTLSYPVDLSKYTGDNSKWQISISMIVDNNNIKVDDLVVEPQP